MMKRNLMKINQYYSLISLLKKGFSEPNKFYFPEGIDNVEVSKQNMDILEEKRILRDAEEKEQLRKAQEMMRQRYEEIKKGNKEFMLKMKVPNVPENPEKVQVYGLNNGMFSVNGLWVPGSVLLFPYRFFMWGVVDAHEIKTHTLDIVKVIKPKPTYLIIGTGKYNVEFEEAFYEHFRKHKMIVETMPTFEAIAQFNTCNEDDMDICAALIPDNL